MRKMGAKLPVRMKPRRVTCRCDICGSTFQNIQALRTHQAYLHPRTKRVAYKPKTEVIARRKSMLLKKSKPASSKAIKPEKNVKPVEVKIPKVNDENKDVTDIRRTGFECPVCSKLFTVYFSAYRHIQNLHCVNDKGEAVSPNSSALIKPLHIEQCITCNVKVDAQKHTCANLLKFNEENAKSKQTCLGCQQEFLSMDMFSKHIIKEHKVVENFFFPDMNKFMMWKKNMETQIETRYFAMKKMNNIQIFHCNNFTSNETTSMFCPASITQQVYPKGIKVTYYKEHCGHLAKEYVIPDAYQKYVITHLLESCQYYKRSRINTDDNDMYSEIKILMENIVMKAAKCNISNLNLLMGKALEMTTVINNQKHDEEQHNNNTNKNVTDEEIGKLLSESQNKRKTDDEDEDTLKRAKRETVAKVEPRVVSSPGTPKSTDKTDAKESAREVRPHTRSNQQTKHWEANKDATIKSPTSFSETYQNFIDVNFKSTTETSVQDNSTPRSKKKESLKTKMGQFKPNILKSSKDDKIQESPPKAQFTKILPKVDFKYEVLERENECNILIIKI